ncbi:hypothetical protein [Clostridium perfringens]
MTDCRYAVPMKTFTKTNKIPLDKLRNDLPNFIVPRMYYYIDDSELLEYLQTNLLPTEDTRINDFSFIADIDIC